ncbi:hypothetical protein Rsub_09892 [Raphidocelis subcapitata]|uniref:Seipin n=1 Tax=Raphidocelis subcapitata TaxID=307507 RepID=A0A2V0PHZ1_9CHLO|nr:hypothetical protein Rsub_09892 [Raphidocelis subcapitata]|eukprot:GBF96887.1 hypothetical protein Rsub_09892 [Raphidocelis subcapitata]
MFKPKAATRADEDLFQDMPYDDLKVDGSSVSRFSQRTAGSSDAGGGGRSGAAAATGGGGGGGVLSPPSIRTLSALQATLLALLAALSWAVACSGTFMLGWLLVSRMYLPSEIAWDRPLYFDYGGSVSTAMALVPLTRDPDASPAGLLADPSAGGGPGGWADDFPLAHGARGGGGGAGGGAAGARLLLSPGRRASVSVRLRLPPPGDQDLFQVTGELLTADGRLLGRAARTHVPRRAPLVPRLLRWAVTAPWAALGLYDDSERVELLLFDGFGAAAAQPGAAGGKPPRKRAAARARDGGDGDGGDSSDGKAPAGGAAAGGAQPPVPAYFRAKLVGRSPSSGPPRIYAADMHLEVKLGWLEGLLFRLSPGPLFALVLLAGGAAMALGGGGAAGALLVAAFAVFRWGGRAAERLAASQAGAGRGGAAGRGGGGGGGSSAGWEDEEEEDASSGQWTPVAAPSGASRAAAAAAAGKRSRLAGGGGGGGEGGSGSGSGAGGSDDEGEFLEPSSPFESGPSGSGAVGAIRAALAQQSGSGGRDVFLDAGGDGDGGAGGGGGGGEGGAAGGEAWQHIIAGGGSDGDGGSPGRGAAALNRRRGWLFRS